MIGTAFAFNSNPDVVTVPGGFMNATMNAHALTGTFVRKFGYSTGIALYAINFVAGVYVPRSGQLRASR